MQQSLKILVLRFSSIGDIVLTTPVLRCIKKTYPEAIVHYATKPAYAPLLRGNPYLDSIKLLPQALRPWLKALRQERYTHIIDLHHNIRTAVIKAALGVPAHSFPKYNRTKWSMVNMKRSKGAVPHVVTRYFSTVKPLGVHNDDNGLDIFLPSKAQVDFRKLGISDTTSVLTAAIGGTYATKKMPVDQWKSLLQRLPYPVVLLGGAEDLPVAEALQRDFPGQVLHRIGRWSVLESAAAILQSALLITHDTGMMHIGAALQKPMVTLWGNTVPGFGMTPYYGKNHTTPYWVFEVEELSCRPCSKLGFDRCPKGHFKCMVNQPLDAIADQIKGWMSNR